MKNEAMKYVIFALLYFILTVILFQVFIYNVTIIDITSTFYSVFWLFLIIYIIFLIFMLIKAEKYTNHHILGYSNILRFVLLISFFSFVFLIVTGMFVSKELNLSIYIKFLFSFLIVSILTSLIYFLEISFRKYRVLWIIGFIGTIIFSQLLVEAEMFVDSLIIKSLLDFWNLIVPYRSIEQLRQFVLFEGWQGLEIALASAIHLLIYWFVVASICLYIRQFQSKWELPEVR